MVGTVLVDVILDRRLAVILLVDAFIDFLTTSEVRCSSYLCIFAGLERREHLREVPIWSVGEDTMYSYSMYIHR